MKLGTKSILFGAHCFLLHPLFVALAWWKLYGFPFDPRLWVAFFVHDLGYWGLSNIDGEEGEKHPYFGASIMHFLFDRPYFVWKNNEVWAETHWYYFTLLHSRHYAKWLKLPFSRLCVADKLAFVLTPAWLYIPMTSATGELNEYITNARDFRTTTEYHKAVAEGDKERATALHHIRMGALALDAVRWKFGLDQYMLLWVRRHADGAKDEWTVAERSEAA